MSKSGSIRITHHQSEFTGEPAFLFSTWLPKPSCSRALLARALSFHQRFAMALRAL